MNVCAHNGYLVDANHTLPADPTDFAVEGLPPVGCTRIHCRRCGVAVRNVVGLGVASPVPLDDGQLAALYALDDLATSPLLKPNDYGWRLYLCRCFLWEETSEHRLYDPEPTQSDPQAPWECSGHPTIALPGDIDGSRIAMQTELRELVIRAFHGQFRRVVRNADRERANWMVRLRARLGSAHCVVVDQAALAALDNSDPHVRSRVLQYVLAVPSDVVRDRLATELVRRQNLFADVPDEYTFFKGDTLQDTAWRIVGPLVGKDGPARDRARDVALAGRARSAILDTLAAHDASWLIAHIDDIARVAPGCAGVLIESFSQLPDDKQAPDHAARVRLALIGDEPVDEIRAANHEFAKRARNDVPGEGPFAAIKQLLPALRSGSQLELEIGVVPTSEARYLQVRIKAPDGRTSTRDLVTGRKGEVISFLKAEDSADRILFQVRDAEARR